MRKYIKSYILLFFLFISASLLNGQTGCDLLKKLSDDLASNGSTLRPYFESPANASAKGIKAWEALIDLPLLRTNVTKLQEVSDFAVAKNIDPSLVKTELNALSNYKGDLIKSFEISNGTLPHPLIPIRDGVIQTDGNLLGRLINGQFVPVGNANAAGNMDYVIMQSGEILLGSKHTFLSGGADVLAAGTVKFNNGTIKAITNASGHYLPTPGEGMNFLRLFKANGADISNATLSMYHDAGTLFKEILPSSPVRKLYD